MATSYLIIGPAPFIQMEPSFALICTSQALRGVGAGFIIICAYSNAMRVAVEDVEHPDDVKTRSFVCSTFSFFASVTTIPLAPLSGFLGVHIRLQGRLHVDVRTPICMGFPNWIHLACTWMAERRKADSITGY
ncbi:hypothetical protein MTO96_005367 [Rhipicephalus appendiculatus]